MDFYSRNKLRTGREEVTGFDSLIFDDVTFSHENGTEIVKNASFSMQYGEILGLSGESGSGKTTILELICGLRSPNNGCILVNKTNLELINLNSWQKKYSLVTQEPRLISGSATENIEFFSFTFTKFFEIGLRFFDKLPYIKVCFFKFEY